jgi:hypothetical protein
MESGLITIFGGALQVAGGILSLLLGLIISEHLDSFLLLFTQRDTPDYVKDKPGVHVVLNYIKGMGIMFLILGVGLMVFGIIRIGIQIFWY